MADVVSWLSLRIALILSSSMISNQTFLFSQDVADAPIHIRPSFCLAACGLGVGKELRGRVLAITLGVVADPAPEILASLLQCLLSLPVELLVGQGWVGSKIENIALASGDNIVGQIAADNMAESLDHLKDGAATAGTEVPGLNTRLVLAEVVEGAQVALGQIDNVDVVADGGTVSRGVVYL